MRMQKEMQRVSREASAGWAIGGDCAD